MNYIVDEISRGLPFKIVGTPLIITLFPMRRGFPKSDKE
jgi:hypothetical protein